MKNIRKRYKYIALLLLIVFLTSGCSLNNDYSYEVKDVYNIEDYTDCDNYGRKINSFWLLAEEPIIKADIIVNGSKKTAKVYDDSKFSMFLYFNYTNYCLKDYQFPDYRNDSSIEKIIITPNNNTDFFSSSCIVISNKNDIELIKKLLIDASNSSNWQNNSVQELSKSNDWDIGIKFADCEAVLYYGYISINQDNDFGLYCADVECANYLYTIDKNTLNILTKYSNDFLN